MCSFEVTWEWEEWTRTTTFTENEEPDANANIEAQGFFLSLSTRFTSCDKRRVAPLWSVSNEVCLQVLQPIWRKQQEKAVCTYVPGAAHQNVG